MTTDALVIAGYVAFGAGGLGGTWLFLKETAYAGSHPGSDLAGVLQIVGLILIALSVGGLAAVTLLQRAISGRHRSGRTS